MYCMPGSLSRIEYAAPIISGDTYAPTPTKQHHLCAYKFLLIIHVVLGTTDRPTETDQPKKKKKLILSLSSLTFHHCVRNKLSDVVVTRYAAHQSVTQRRWVRTVGLLPVVETGDWWGDGGDGGAGRGGRGALWMPPGETW